MEEEPKVETPPKHVELTPPPEPVPDADDATERFFRGAASEEEVARADDAAARRLTAQQQKPSSFFGALWEFLRALWRFSTFVVFGFVFPALASLSVILITVAVIAFMFLTLAASPYGKIILKNSSIYEFAKDLSDLITDFNWRVGGVPRIPKSELSKSRQANGAIWISDPEPCAQPDRITWDIKFCDYSLESKTNPLFFEKYRNTSANWTAKERLRRYGETPPVSARELDSWSVRGTPLWTIAGIMLESNQTANETLFGLPHEQSRMLCMHQFKHSFDFERRICVLSRGPVGAPAQVLINPVLKGFSDEESAMIVKERSRICEGPFLKSRRPVLDVQFTIDAPSENERHRPVVVRTIIDDPVEALAFQMRWQEMQGIYECK